MQSTFLQDNQLQISLLQPNRYLQLLKMQQPLLIWYFAFGEPAKSSLLNQYSREHSINYLKSPKSIDLQKYQTQQCIIEAEIETLLQWQPKKSNISVIFIGSKFTESQQQLMKEYKQIARCKHHLEFKDYQKFRKLMYPNIIFFYGPDKQSRQGAAITFAFQSLYNYVQKFPKSANQMMKLRKSENYTFSWMFTDPKQIQVVLSRFNVKIVHFRYKRSDFPNEEKYFDEQYGIVKYLQGKGYFLSLQSSKSSQALMDQIGEFLCPKLTFVNSNNLQQKEYALSYALSLKTQLLSIFQIQSINKRKNIALAYTLQDKIRRLNQVIYNDLTKEQIVLVDFPWHANQMRVFQNVNRKLSHFVDLDPEREYMYSSIYTSSIYFLETQRRVHPTLQFSLISQIQRSKRYWIIIGPQGVGKTTVAKYLQQQYGLSYIQFQPYISALKEKLLTPEDGQELPAKKIITHFRELFAENKQKQYVIDGFSFSHIKEWISQVGSPIVISLRVDENQLIKRQRRKAETDINAEITEEELQKSKQSIQKQAQFSQQLSSTSPQTIIYNVDYTQPTILAQKLLQSIYQPRVFLIQSMPTLLYHNIAIRYNCCFINLALNSLEQAKKIAKQSGKRDVIIANYRQTQQKLLSEDLYWIQKNIGKLRYLAIWDGEEKNYKEELIEMERPLQEKKAKKVPQDEQGEQPVEEQAQQEEGEVKKKKLDIYAYQWTKPISHKNLSQWYFKLKKNVQQFTTNPKEAYKTFRTKLQQINNSPNLSIYEVIKPVQQ